MHSIFVGKTLRIEKSIGRIGALAVALGVGVGLGTSLTCGIAHADGSDSTSAGADQTSKASSRGHGAGGASVGAGRRSSTHGGRRPADGTSGGSAAQTGDTVDTKRRHGRSISAAQPDESTMPAPTAERQQTDIEAGGGETVPAEAGRQRVVRSRTDQPAQPRIDMVVNVGDASPAPVATASVAAPSADQAIGSTLGSLSGTGLPGLGTGLRRGGDPVGAPTTLVLLAGAGREFGGRSRVRQAVASSVLSSQTGPDGPTPSVDSVAAKRLSALVTPRAAASPLESFIGTVGSLINTALTAINNAVSTALTAINTAVTTAVTAISNTITNLLTAIGVISKPNDAPSAVNDTVTTAEDSAVSVTAGTLLGNDSDPDGDTLTVTGVSSGAHGTAVLNGTTVTYTPTANFSGADSFTYTVSDGRGGTATATVAVTVTAVNDGPVAGNNTVTTAEDSAVSVTAGTLLGNDSDPDGDTLSVTGVSSGAHGTAVLNGTTVTYTPTANFSGVDSFTYTVSDGHGGTATATVAVTVTAVNDGPVAGNNTVTTAEDSAVSVTAGTLLGNDSDPDGDALAVTGVSSGAHGSAVLNGTTVTYTPTANFNGADSFTYTVSDGHGGTATATVAVTVTAVNDAPVAGSNSVSTVEGTPVSVSTTTLLGNDSDVDGDTLSVTGISQPGHGSAVLDGGTLTYTPDADFHGVDSLTYTVSDGHGGTATGTVSVTVTSVNDAPIAGGDAVTTAEDTAVSISTVTLLGNDSDKDGDTLSVTGISQPGHGSAVLDGGTLTYTPDADFHGVDSLTYTVSDGHGGTVTGTVSVTITPVNDAPTAVNDSASTAPNTAVTIDVLGNDTDVDGDPLSVTVAGTAAHGTVAVNEDGTITYTPNENYTGTDSFTYTISDGTTGNSAAVTVKVAVPTQSSLTLASFDQPQIQITASGGVYVVGKAFVEIGDTGMGYDRFVVGRLGEDGMITPVIDLDNIGWPYLADVTVGPDGRVYVLDNGWSGADGTLTVYDTYGTPHVILDDGELGSVDIGTDLSGDAVHMAVGNDGKIYLTAWAGFGEDAIPSALTVLNPDGSVAVAPVDLGFRFSDAKDLVVGADGHAYILGVDPNSSTYTVVVVGSSGSVDKRISLANLPGSSIAVGADGTVYVASNDGVFTVNASGPFGVLNGIPSDGTDIEAIAMGTQGLYVLKDNALSVVDPGSIKVQTVLDSVDDFKYIVGLTVGPDGARYVAGVVDTFLGVTRIAKVDVDGTVSDLGPVALNGFGSFDAGSDGLIYTAGPGGITVINTVTGSRAIITVRSGGASHVAVSQDGAVYFTGYHYDPDSGTVVGYLSAIDSDGNVVLPPVNLGDQTSHEVTGLAVGSDGRIYLTSYVSDTRSAEMTILQSNGTVESTVPLGSGGSTGLAVGADGTAYVINNGRVIAVDSSGPIGTVRFGSGLASVPTMITVGNDGLLYVAVNDYTQATVTSSISVLDPTDLVEDGTSNGLSEFVGLYGIAVDSGGQKYVLGYNYDSSGSTHSKLVVVSADGTSVTQLADLGPGSGAVDVEIGADGRLMVTDVALGTVTAYDPVNGYAPQLIRSIAGAAGLALGNGRIYVSSVITNTDAPQSGKLTILNGDGSLMTTVDLGGAALGASVGPDGRVYVVTASSDSGTSIDGALLIFSSGGVLQKTIALPNRASYNVTVGPNGTAYIADVTGHVVAVGQDGRVSDLAAVAFPVGLDIGPDGKLYVTSAVDTTGQGPSITVIDTATNL
ncbi:tandem-95 repeat protein [Mycobacterium sp. ELW1]|uniref:cadherin-like domain-containing protein n=1 Tax=Mycobacterium sp. ELW1 TaxID=1547487 RepID=UPI0011EC7177|nr:tandem-95 repeat protein [Mycobacterium sp. ELW1]QEN12031.1 tandem-95 repeat protein [Mycobacterium sp. ELW1]